MNGCSVVSALRLLAALVFAQARMSHCFCVVAATKVMMVIESTERPAPLFIGTWFAVSGYPAAFLRSDAKALQHAG